MIRIGILAHGFANWGGGIDFLRVVASSLHHADPHLELHVLVPLQGPLIRLRNLRDWTLRRRGKVSALDDCPSLADLERAFSGTGATLHLIDIGPRAVARAASRLCLDALLPAIAPQPTDNPPWVGYVFDFQHRRLPHFFSREESEQRDDEFERMLNSASAVVVNSRDVVQDINRYFPNRRARVYALPFSPAPGSDAFSVNVHDACLRHGVRRPYFIVCNQFWKHKDHGTAFRAFAMLANRYPDLSLVCTGATSDYRFPGYFEGLIQEAETQGFVDRIHSLGLIPKLDQLALVRGAIALVQPTLFEGGPGGGAVYDAVALGQRAIASDIPVNLEIDDPMVTFFRTADAESLAASMESAYALAETETLVPDPVVLMARGAERRRACGVVLLQAVAEAISVSV